MTLTGMCKELAVCMQQQAAFNEHRMVWRLSEFTDYDIECVSTYENRLIRLFSGANGRLWSEIRTEIRRMAPDGFHFGFRAQDEVINICEKYGIKMK